MIEKVLIFLVFLSPLIFFHELGHYFFARLFGVRVEVFSIGFGPKLFKFKRGDTTWSISAIPLGGYVKMYGDDVMTSNEIPTEERKNAFTHKGKWARFWIVFGGPLANFILAYVIIYSLLLTGEKVPEAKFGIVTEKSIFHEKGFKTGDRFSKVNGDNVLGLTDFSLKTEGQEIETLTVNRRGEMMQLPVNISAKRFLEEFFKLVPRFRKPVVLSNLGQYFAVSLSEQVVDWTISLEELKALNPKRIYLHEVIKNESSPVGYDVKPGAVSGADTKEDLVKTLWNLKFWPLDLVIGSVMLNSAADKGGLKGGDVITAVAGMPITNFDMLRNKLQEIPEEKPVEVTYFRKGKEAKTDITPEVNYTNGESLRLIGVYSGGEILPPKYLQSEPLGVFESFGVATVRTWDSLVSTVMGFKKLITGEVSFKNIGGPIAIGKVAADSWDISFSYFFKLMALISVNLGIINLFPIPVLDGGHIMFILFELINRGPLSRRKMEIAQQFGVSLLFILIIAALVNDFSRFF